MWPLMSEIPVPLYPDAPVAIYQHYGETLVQLYERLQIVERQFPPNIEIGVVHFVQRSGRNVRMSILQFVTVMNLLTLFEEEKRPT